MVIKWNRRARAAIKFKDAKTLLRGKILGVGLSREQPTWGEFPKFTFHGVDMVTNEKASVAVWGCRICAALVDEENRAYHERWHIAGSISP